MIKTFIQEQERAIEEKVQQLNALESRNANLLRRQILSQWNRYILAKQAYARWLAELDYMKLLEQESAKRIDEENAELLNRGLLGQSKQRARVEIDETADRHSGVMNDEFLARLALLSGAEEGRRDLDYFEHEGKVNLGYDRLNDNGKSEVTKINPFTDKRPVGLKWVNDSIDLNLKLNNKE